MITTIEHKGKTYTLDLSNPLDISIPLRAGSNNVNAWYSKPVSIEPVVMGDWVGDVNRGGSVNFRDICLNPHGNGTHTECVGHISKENISLNNILTKFFFIAEVISVTPEKIDGDNIVMLSQIEHLLKNKFFEALIIRTLPNSAEKLEHQYSNTNPPYVDPELCLWLVKNNINHLLIDLPSVDREKDEGKLLAHHAFWQYPQQTRMEATITEMIFVEDSITDGQYLLNIQITSLENDASPSKPVLYTLKQV